LPKSESFLLIVRWRCFYSAAVWSRGKKEDEEEKEEKRNFLIDPLVGSKKAGLHGGC
jgi:hypothetical protein